ncbi:hypothetical protein [Clostridium pasteurianum]|uniref:Uncharacterized protein n=1 Tax=Clostridium pasteurianum BC1 TaxID=86416 RepID=R4K440_CLOPA|nr:hypothetical protein [Clostridium pasteurianum]AGK97907.1 hypothetical protein Clopa_3085 [Clostridium pasteurianum BC1]
MKDINKLLIEMDNLTAEQIAIGLNTNDKDELLSLLGSANTQDDSISCNNIVNFESTISIPNKIEATPNAREFVFKSFLNRTTGQPITVPVTPQNCSGTIPITLYPIKIVGFIQYIGIANVIFNNGFNISITDNTTTTPLTATPLSPSSLPPKTSYISLQDSIGVDTVIGYTVSADKYSNPIPSSVLSVSLNPFTVSGQNILFSGHFILPLANGSSSLANDLPTPSPDLPTPSPLA